MRIKVGDQWFDCENQPIMVEFTDADKRRLQCTFVGHCYAVFNSESGMTQEQKSAWAKDGQRSKDELMNQDG